MTTPRRQHSCRRRFAFRQPVRAFRPLEPLEDRHLLSATISGSIFNDANGNGVQDNGETGVSHRVVFLDSDGDGVFDSGEASRTTDANGAYSFTGLGQGTHRVALANPPGWTQTSPRTTGMLNFKLPMDDPRDLVFDATRQLLYITTTEGHIERFHVPSLRFFTPIDVGAALLGADITPDDAFLYVAEDISNTSQGNIRKVNLETGEVTNLPFDRVGDEDGAFDIAIGSGDKAYFSTSFAGSGGTPFREINLIDDTISQRQDKPNLFGGSNIDRGPNRETILITQSISNGPFTTIDAVTDSIIADSSLGTSVGNSPLDVNRDGTIIGIGRLGLKLFDTSFNLLHDIPDLEGGHIFDPNQDVVYAFDDRTDELVALNTNTLEESFRIQSGEDTRFTQRFREGVMAITDDSSIVFRTFDDGVLVMSTRPVETEGIHAVAVGTNSQVVNIDFGVQQREAKRIEGQLWQDDDGDGTLDPGEQLYSGRVVYVDLNHNGVNDSGEPQQVTDALGRYAFADLPHNSVGAEMTTVAVDVDASPWDPTHPATYSSEPVLSVLPISNEQDLIFDDFRNRLYAPTSAGTVEIFDVTTQSFLTPVTTGGALRGGDMTMDGAFLYVADTVQSAGGKGVVRKINLDTFAFTTIEFNVPSSRDIIVDVEIGANNKGLITFADSFFSSMYILDVSTDVVTAADQIIKDTYLSGSGDGTSIFLANNALSDGMIRTWDPFTQSFSNEYETNSGPDQSALNADGSLIALEVLGGVSIMDANYDFVETYKHIDGGFVFDRTRDILYAADHTTDEFIVHDVTRRDEILRVPIGFSIGQGRPFDNGVMAVSGDGRYVYLTTNPGILVVDLGTREPAASRTYLLEEGQRVVHADFGSTDVAPPQTNGDDPAGPALQRSRIDAIQFQFSEFVIAQLQALTLFNVTVNAPVDLADMAFSFDPQTLVGTWTFPGLVGQSLADGNYEAVLSGDLILDQVGLAFDGDSDGQAGGNLLFNLHRLFGDTDGDRSVGPTDLFTFRNAFGTTTGDVQFRQELDFENDGEVGTTDLFQFRNNFGSTLPPVAPLQVQDLSGGLDNLALLAGWQENHSPSASETKSPTPWLNEIEPSQTWELN